MSDKDLKGTADKRKAKDKEFEVLLDDLKESIGAYLDSFVKEPALQTVDHELSVQQDIVAILIIFKINEQLILDHGADIDLQNLGSLSRGKMQDIVDILSPFIVEPNDTTYSARANEILDTYINKKYLCSYWGREINWIAVSLLSASYISSMILIRSMFELLIGIATNAIGGMSTKIDSISYMSVNEHKAVKKSWNNLCAWTHPYGKWEKEVCPVFISHSPLYHPKLYQLCISELIRLADIFLVISIDKFSIDASEIMEAMKERGIHQTADLEKFPFFMERLRKT